MPVSAETALFSAPRRGFGLYVHWPFCLAKCPYCDFNSHALSADGGLDPNLAETYVNQLITDLHADLEDFGLSPSIHSIFIGYSISDFIGKIFN